MAVSVAVMFGFVALAMDVGRLAVAQTQCQNAADAAAIAGARTLSDGGTTNRAAASTNATGAATASSILGVRLQASEVTTVQHGAYHYDYTQQTFTPVFTNPLPTGDIYNLTQVTITHQVSGTFCRVFGITASTVTATATAAAPPRRGHRPGLLRVDEQRERYMERRKLSGQHDQHPQRPQPRCPQVRAL